MNLPEISIKKPVTVFMMTLILVLFGIVSMTKLPVELYPNTSFGEISIIIQVRGGIPPTEVETLVTKPIEEAVATVSNLKQLLSISKEGESTVVLSFKPGTDMEFAALEVREKFAKIKNQLPKEIEKPVIAQFQQGDVPIVVLAITSERRSTEDIRKIVDQTMKESFRRVTGVANVEVAGGRERKILVEADQIRLAAFGIPIDEVTSALGANNLNLLSGEVERTNDRYLIRVQGEFESLDQIGNMALRRTPEGSIIRVKDVAAVKDSYLEPNEYSRLDTRPVVTMYIRKESTKNTISVAKEILAAADEIQAKLPKDIRMVITSNQAVSIAKNINNLTLNHVACKQNHFVKSHVIRNSMADHHRCIGSEDSFDVFRRRLCSSRTIVSSSISRFSASRASRWKAFVFTAGTTTHTSNSGSSSSNFSRTARRRTSNEKKSSKGSSSAFARKRPRLGKRRAGFG